MTQQSTGTMTHDATTVAPVVGLDVLSTSLRDADAVAHALVRELHSLGAIDVVIASHVVQSGHEPHHVVTVSTADLEPQDVEDAVGHVGLAFDVAGMLGTEGYYGPPELRLGLDDAVARHRARAGGRVVVFPGDHLLLGTVSVADATLWTDIDRVEHLSGEPADPRVPLHTRNFLRPRWHRGELVLPVQRSHDEAVVPFETPFATPCCPDHD
jgi:hypothetical protein